MSKTLVIYHKNCWDGFCAAWLFHQQGAYHDAKFIPAQYGDAPPDCAGTRVFIVDFSYPRDVLFSMAEQAASLTVLDHHATAEQALYNFCGEANAERGITIPLQVIFEMEHSGGYLAWRYLAERGMISNQRPWLVDYTEDRDLWRWALPSSKAINAAIRSYPLDFDIWDRIAQHGGDEYISEGTAILRREQQIIADHVAHARDVCIGEYLVPCVNATTLFSDIAGELAVGKPFAACYFDRADGKRQYSLRSDDNGIDVSEIAKRFGGGGHKHAAGYAVDAS